MNAHDYFRDELPEGRRSKLEPFLVELRARFAEGYSLKQLSRFLAANGISVTPGGVSVFLRRRKQDEIRDAWAAAPSRFDPPMDQETSRNN